MQQPQKRAPPPGGKSPAPPGATLPALNLDSAATAAANLSVLRRLDPDIVQVLVTAGHVCLYGFDVDNKQWSRKEVEGSLFVVKRQSSAPRFQFIVLNRLSTENLKEDLLGEFEFELSPPYLLYRNRNEVNGIWFYQQDECDAVTQTLQKITTTFSKAPIAPTSGGAASVDDGDDIDALMHAGPGAAHAAQQAAQAADPINRMLAGLAMGAAQQQQQQQPQQQQQQQQQRQQAPPPPAAAAAPQSLLPPDFFFQPPQPPQWKEGAGAGGGAAPGRSPAGTSAGAAAAGGPMTRGEVKDVLLKLLTNDQFIDFIHGEITKLRSGN